MNEFRDNVSLTIEHRHLLKCAIGLLWGWVMRRESVTLTAIDARISFREDIRARLTV